MNVGHLWNNVLGAPSEYSAKVLATGPIAYWPLWEASGSAAVCQVNALQNGTYTGVTLGQTGIGDGKTCPLFDGANDVVNIYTTTFRDAFSGAAGSVFLWAKVANVGVWSDSNWRTGGQWKVDTSNTIFIGKTSSANTLNFQYIAGGTTKSVNVNAQGAETGWMTFALTWSKAADQVKVFVYWDNGSSGGQQGATQTGLGTWAGNLASTLTCIGSTGSTPSLVWNGYLAHVAVWTSVLTPTTIASLSVV